MSVGTAAPAAMEWGAAPVPQTGLSNDWGSAAANAVDPLADIDGFDTAQEGVKLGGGRIDVEGVYHLEIADAEFPKDDNGNDSLSFNNRKRIHLRLVALQSVPGQSPAGSAMWHDLEIPNPDDKQNETRNGGNMFAALLSAICSFCVGVGVFRKAKNEKGEEVVIDTATNSTKLQLSTLPQRLKGLQCIGRPKKRTWEADPAKQTKAGFEMQFPWGNGVSQIGDPQNAAVPMCEPALLAGGLKRYVAPQAAPAANGGGQAKPANAAPQQSANIGQAQSSTQPAGKFDEL